MNRKSFLQQFAFLSSLLPLEVFFLPRRPAFPELQDRQIWLGLLQRLAGPVLKSMRNGQLHKDFVLEKSPAYDGRDSRVAYMECFGRLMAGISPWLALPDEE